MNNATLIGATSVFGDQFKTMFIDAVAAVGNFGEMYARYLENYVPRQGMNLINLGNTPLIYSHPFGEQQSVGPAPIVGGTLEAIVERKTLRCGLAGGSEFSDLSRDYCLVLAAGIFGSSDGYLELVDLSETKNFFLALANRTVDVLSTVKVSLAADVLEPTSGEGFSFSQPVYYFNNTTSSGGNTM